MKWTVRRKLFSAFSALLLLMLLVGGAGIWTTAKMTNEYEFLLDDRVHKVNIIDHLIQVQKDEVSAVRGFLLYEDDSFLAELDTSYKEFQGAYKALSEIVRSQNVTELLDKLLEEQEVYQSLSQKTMTLKKANNDEYIVYAKQAVDKNDTIIEIADEIKTIQVTLMDETRQELNQLLKTTRNTIITILIIALIGGIVLAMRISVNIAHPIQVMTQNLEEVAAGNLALEPVNIKNSDEIGLMATTFNKMTNDLKNTIQQTSDSAMELAAQSEQLSAGSQESLAASQMVASVAEESMKSSEEQVNIVNDAVTSMNEMASGIQQITDSNEEMITSSEAMMNLVENGSEVVSYVSAQMTDIHQTIEEASEQIQVMANHSEEIQKATALITDISEQTNLLALNAAIEAARAGEYGNGFAVVAEEVRNLAEQSRRSTEEIALMVETIQKGAFDAVHSISLGDTKVNEGLSASERSLAIFNEIEDAVNHTGQSIENVSAAIEEIQAMSDEVANGAQLVKDLTEASMGNAQETSAATEEQLATAEQISSSNQQLASLAEDLQMEVSRFKLS